MCEKRDLTAKRLAKLTEDEFIELRLALKADTMAAKERQRSTNAAWRELIARQRIQDRIDAAGLKGVVVIPDTLVMTATGEEPETA